MTLRYFCCICLLSATATICAKSPIPSGEYCYTPLEKSVQELHPDSIAPDSPLNFFRLRSWVTVNGRYSMWSQISTKKFDFTNVPQDAPMDSARASAFLGNKVLGVLSFRDSSAVIISRESPDFYLLDYTWFEDGRWVNGGQNFAVDSTGIAKNVIYLLPNNYRNISRINAIHNYPEGTAAFADFVAAINDSPEEFLLKSLRSHPLVISGEYHRRKVSWDMLCRLISFEDFPETTGTIFMELPSWHQPTIDAFMSATIPDKEKLLEIFRDEQPNGWWDKGEFDFLCRLWHLNSSLPDNRKIKVVLADYQIPYSRIKNADDAKEEDDRNTHMADIITHHMESSADPRSCLFIVGCGHAYKSAVPGSHSTPRGLPEAPSAAAQLAARLGGDKVFCITQHSISMDNSGTHLAQVRGGAFDEAFAANGNRPVGFALKDSPFGAEPFDAQYEMKYDFRTGTYADNFDGYLFLHPIDNEPQNTPLLEIFTPEFISEMKRRASVLQLEKAKWMWFGTTSGEMTTESVIKALTD